MTRRLPSRPSFEHLRNEAKALLKSHHRGDAAVCAVLRLLHRFTHASDRDILAAEIALHDMQFALALDYGFNSWHALKVDIASRQFVYPTAEICRENNRVWIAGIPPNIGRNSVLASASRCLLSLGVAADYEWLMGAGSHAFRIQFNWCPSGPHAFCGFNTVNPALASVGYSLIQLSTTRPSHRDDLDGPGDDDVSRALDAVRIAIDHGIPCIADWEESDVINGYEVLPDGHIGLVNAGGQSVADLPWSVSILQQDGFPPPRRDSILWSLRTAVTHAHAPVSSGYSMDERMEMSYPGGFTAWEKWITELDTPSVPIDTLPDDEWFGKCHGNAWILDSLHDARLAAAGYLRTCMKDLPAIADSLHRASALYREIGSLLEVARRNTRYPWQPNARAEWTAQARREQAEIMAAAFAVEQQAIDELEKALATI